MTVTNLLAGLTVLISLAAFNNRELFERLLHSPYIEVRRKEYYRLLSSGFIHADFMHLFINMFVFYQFGNFVERIFKSHFGIVQGSLLYMALYLGAIVAGDIPSFLKHKDHPGYRAIGASGGVSGIMLAYVIFQPWENIYIYGVLGIPAVIAAVLYLVYSSWASKRNRDNIGHDAHFYGAVFGFVFTLLISPAFMKHFWYSFTNGLPF